MKITILTLFKEQFDSFKNTSIIKRALDKNVVEIEVINFRDYSSDRLKRVDDAPYGGGAGMVLMCQPIFDCVKSIRTDDSKVILLTPSGKVYNQSMAYDLSHKKHLSVHHQCTPQRLRLPWKLPKRLHSRSELTSYRCPERS